MAGYFHINTNTTQLIQKGIVKLEQIIANQTGSANWLCTIYDGVDTTGAVVGVCDANNGGNYTYGCTLTKGLYVSTSGTTPGDITIIYG